jgi:hypothetical protein
VVAVVLAVELVVVVVVATAVTEVPPQRQRVSMGVAEGGYGKQDMEGVVKERRDRGGYIVAQGNPT